MRSLYTSPFRVYLSLALLCGVGLLLGSRLPISLYPNSSKPTLEVSVPLAGMPARDFLNAYGRDLEDRLLALTIDGKKVDRVSSDYGISNLSIQVEFGWGISNTEALRETTNLVNSLSGQWPEEVRSGLSVNSWSRGTGFIAISFYSPTRDLDSLYRLLEPIFTPELAKISDAEGAGLFNPNEKEIRIDLNPEKLALYQLTPRTIERALGISLRGYVGGKVPFGLNALPVEIPRFSQNVEDLKRVIIPVGMGGPGVKGVRAIQLGDVAQVDVVPKQGQMRLFKTSGVSSLILFGTPKPGANLKRMAEDIVKLVKRIMPSLPPDIENKVLVDPSEFIRASVNNVIKEVLLGAFLAVLVLFVFIGSLRNTVTAAIEIPASMILAFILMKLTGMNLNLISLGGLALSAGMNVDASVVVMENIFRHFDRFKQPLSAQERLEVVLRAVGEVKFPLLVSTIASLVVFVPLAFTSDLTNAILGDLAKTVVFSHGFSALVALVLVPTVRLHLMNVHGSHVIEHSPFEKWIQKIEAFYRRVLMSLIERPRLQIQGAVGILLTLALLFGLVLPRLPKEIIGLPDSDWIFLGISSRGNTKIAQMESEANAVEQKVIQVVGQNLAYTFDQISDPNFASVMIRLKDRHKMEEIWKTLEHEFQNTPTLRFNVNPWNPAELPIPNPPQMRIEVKGGSDETRSQRAEEVYFLLQEKQVFPRLWVDPDAGKVPVFRLKPNSSQWLELETQTGGALALSDLADLTRIATSGRRVGRFSVEGRDLDLMFRFAENRIQNPEDLEALPVGVNQKVIPLKALVHTAHEETLPSIFRENGQEQIVISGRVLKGHEKESKENLKRAENLVAEWKAKITPKPQDSNVSFADAEKDLTQALSQLSIALSLSIILIFTTLLLQFGNFRNALLVMIAIPLGFIGVLISLWVFNSSVSLNSVLGVILLNGIAVANSILIVDFAQRKITEGVSPAQAAVTAAADRLRPILITSMTTILGMTPIALGLGEGGRILQPLGIAVAGGLWVSMVMTLFVVPVLISRTKA